MPMLKLSLWLTSQPALAWFTTFHMSLYTINELWNRNKQGCWLFGNAEPWLTPIPIPVPILVPILMMIPLWMSGCHSIELHVVLAFIMVVYSFISDYDVIVFDSVHWTCIIQYTVAYLCEKQPPWTTPLLDVVLHCIHTSAMSGFFPHQSIANIANCDNRNLVVQTKNKYTQCLWVAKQLY